MREEKTEIALRLHVRKCMSDFSALPRINARGETSRFILEGKIREIRGVPPTSPRSQPPPFSRFTA